MSKINFEFDIPYNDEESITVVASYDSYTNRVTAMYKNPDKGDESYNGTPVDFVKSFCFTDRAIMSAMGIEDAFCSFDWKDDVVYHLRSADINIEQPELFRDRIEKIIKKQKQNGFNNFTVIYNGETYPFDTIYIDINGRLACKKYNGEYIVFNQPKVDTNNWFKGYVDCIFFARMRIKFDGTCSIIC